MHGNLCDFTLSTGFLAMTPKAQAKKNVQISWISSKFKNFVVQITPSRKLKKVLVRIWINWNLCTALVGI